MNLKSVYNPCLANNSILNKVRLAFLIMSGLSSSPIAELGAEPFIFLV